VSQAFSTDRESTYERAAHISWAALEFGVGAQHRQEARRAYRLAWVDENGSPVILEYKRATNQNVINQGLFYLDWLLDPRAEFQLLAQRRFGAKVAEAIDWTNPRLICVAGDFTLYDEHALLQINRSIELVRYRDYGWQLLAVELLTSADAKTTAAAATTGVGGASGGAPSYKTILDLHGQAPQKIKKLLDSRPRGSVRWIFLEDPGPRGGAGT
jgi:hypothetical protein